MAENNIATAEVTINTSRVTGNVKKSGGNNSKELKVLTSILKSMKQSTAIAVKSSKLSLSGLAGAAGIAGGIGSVLTGIGVAIAGAVVGTQAAINEAGRTGGTTFNGVSSTGYFQKAVIDGEDKVIEVNERTGEIVNILTMREARERGILDANDEVYANVLASKGKWAENIKNLDVQGATLHLSLQQLIGLLDEEELAKRNMTEYNRLLQIRNEKLAESIRKTYGGRTDANNNFVSDSLQVTFINPTYMDLVHSQQAYYDEQVASGHTASIQMIENVFPEWVWDM